MSKQVDRRTFLKEAGTAGVGLGMAPRFASAASRTGSRVPNASDAVTIAVIGLNGRGSALAEMLVAMPGVAVSYVADVDDRAIAKGMGVVARTQKRGATGLKDFRRALDDKTLDAVAVATPDHWHAPMAILALSAGKHVYLEKPCSHNPREGELLVQAVAKHQRVVQVGVQRRSFPNMQQAIAEIRNGAIGKAYFARAWYANGRTSIGRGQPAAVPQWLDYELWQGPAPRRPFRDNLIHYNWHWFWHWGTGEALNNGTHEVDVCRWALGVDWPTRVTSNGGRYHFDDDWETPDTQVIAWDFPGGRTISWESRSCNRFPVERLDRGVLVFGTSGSALLDGNNYTFFDAQGKAVKEVRGADTQADRTNTLSSTGLALDQLHVKNFIDAIRGGGAPSAPVDEGHKSVAILHLGNIAWRVQRELHCDPATGRPQNDPDAMKLWGREYERGWAPVV